MLENVDGGGVNQTVVGHPLLIYYCRDGDVQLPRDRVIYILYPKMVLPSPRVDIDFCQVRSPRLRNIP